MKLLSLSLVIAAFLMSNGVVSAGICPNPEGSYLASCDQCKWQPDNTTYQCYCKKSDGTAWWFGIGMKEGQCFSCLRNDNGRLMPEPSPCPKRTTPENVKPPLDPFQNPSRLH